MHTCTNAYMRTCIHAYMHTCSHSFDSGWMPLLLPLQKTWHTHTHSFLRLNAARTVAPTYIHACIRAYMLTFLPQVVCCSYCRLNRSSKGCVREEGCAYALFPENLAGDVTQYWLRHDSSSKSASAWKGFSKHELPIVTVAPISFGM
jgi:hypothetical protein